MQGAGLGLLSFIYSLAQDVIFGHYFALLGEKEITQQVQEKAQPIDDDVNQDADRFKKFQGKDALMSIVTPTTTLHYGHSDMYISALVIGLLH